MARKWVTILGMVLSLLFLWLAMRNVEFAQVSDALQRVDPVYLIQALVIVAVFNVLVTLRWRYLLAYKHRVSFMAVFSGVMVGYFANNVLPARVGELLRAHVLGKREGMSRTYTMAVIVVERLLDVAATCVILLTVLFSVALPVWTEQILLITGGSLGLAVIGIIIFVWNHERLSARLQRSRLQERLKPVWRRIPQFRDGFESVRSGSRLLIAFLLSLLTWLVSALIILLTLKSFNIQIPLHGVLFTLGVINLGLMIPSSPGYIGTYQFLCVSALGFFGISESTAFTYSLIQQALWFVPVTIVGFFFFSRENLRLNRLPVSEEASTP